MRRVTVGGGIGYAVHARGYNTFNLADPKQPLLIASTNTSQFGWKEIVLNGAGLALAAAGPSSTHDGRHDISLYDVSDPTKTELAKPPVAVKPARP
jgi:hypothetical protein